MVVVDVQDGQIHGLGIGADANVDTAAAAAAASTAAGTIADAGVVAITAAASRQHGGHNKTKRENVRSAFQGLSFGMQSANVVLRA